MECNFDVLIAGAGPAGSEFAYRMARDGYRVLVLEKGPLVREKPCGGGIQTQEIIEFGPLPEAVVERHIETAKIIAPDNGVLEVPKYLEACGATVKRSTYDRWLASRAQQVGAVYRDYVRVVDADLDANGATVYADTPDGRIALKGRLLAIATGANSAKLLSALRIRNSGSTDFAITTQYWVSLDRSTIDSRIGNTIEIYCGRSIVPQGYAWIFPKRDVVAVGVGCTASALKEGKGQLRARLDNFVNRHPVASQKLRGGQVVRRDGGLIPFFVGAHLTAPSTVILGDAGGFGSSIHGGGIYQARKSAAVAEPLARDYLENGSPASLDQYAEKVRDHFNDYEGRWDVKMRPFFWEDDLVNMSVRQACSGDHKITRAMGIVLNSDRSHKEAYTMLEPRMLDMIHDCLKEKIAPYRSMINKSIADLFQTDSVLDRSVRHVLCADAKRIRAALALIATEAAGGDASRALPMAVAFELLHTASLVHDDIMDDAQSRRGRPCVHRVFGIDIAITAGDALIFEAYQQLLGLRSTWDPDRVGEVLRIFSDCALKTCRGQSDDLTFSDRPESIKAYLKMVRKKTGSMIEAPLHGGAVLANACPQWQSRFREFGRALGTAFQIVDDAVDYLGNENKARKTLGNDLRRKKGSAMMIYCREQCSPSERDATARAIERFRSSGVINDTRPVLELLYKYDAIGFTQRLCERTIHRARRIIEDIGNEPARTTLDAIARIVGYWGLLAAKIPDDRIHEETREKKSEIVRPNNHYNDRSRARFDHLP